LDRRLIVFGAAALLGLGAGGLIWGVAGDGGRAREIAALEDRLSSLPTRSRQGPDRPSEALARVLAAPLLGVTDKAAAVAEVPVQLIGLVRRPGRSAALMAIAGAPPQWLALGEAFQGVSLDEISDAGVVLTTPAGKREISLAASSGAPPVGGGPDGAPAGYRSPPPPASAPSVP
jgi:hypothetical protein